MLEEMAEVVNGQMDGIRWFLLTNVSELNKNYSPEMLQIQTDQSLGRQLTDVINLATSERINPYQTYPSLKIELLRSMPGAIPVSTYWLQITYRAISKIYQFVERVLMEHIICYI